MNPNVTSLSSPEGWDALVNDVMNQKNNESVNDGENETFTTAMESSETFPEAWRSMIADVRELKKNMETVLEENETLKEDNEFLKLSLERVNPGKSSPNVVPLENVERPRSKIRVFGSILLRNKGRSSANITQEEAEEEEGEDDDEEEEKSNKSLRLSTFILSRVLSLQKIAHSIKKNDPEDYDQSNVVNTETIHMYAISMLYFSIVQPSRWRKAWAWLMAFSSLLIVWVQVSVMLSVVLDSSNETCTRHEECPSGLYCNGIERNEYRQPRCQDCSVLYGMKDECAKLFGDLDSIADLRDIRETLWFEKDFTPKYYNPFGMSASDESLFLSCLSLDHCSETIPFGLKDPEISICSHLELTTAKLSSDHKIVFFFVILFFASSLANDMQEAIVENVILDHTMRTLHDDEYVPRLVFLLRISNRIREFFIPWVTAAAGASIIIYDAMSAKNIVLNLLAVLFITEADNMLANLFLSPGRQSISNELVETTIRESSKKCPLWVPKVRAVIVSVVLYIMVLNIENITTIFRPSARCSGVNDTLILTLCFFLPLIDMVVQTFYNLILGIKNKNVLERILEPTKIVIAFMVCLLALLAGLAIHGNGPVRQIPAFSLSVTFCIGLCFHHILKFYKNTKVALLVVGIAWAASLSWMMSGIIKQGISEAQ